MKFRLSQNSTKFDMVARFRETIPTVKSVSSSKIYKNFGFLPKLPFYPFSENWNFLRSYKGSPKVSTSCTDLMGSTRSLENPRRQALTGSSFSIPMSFLSKADVKMMSVELSLSTRTL